LARGDTGVQDARQAATASVLARETSVEGQISGSRPVRIEGSLKGSVRLDAPLDVVAGALVEADVHATVVRVAGTVTGNISATELIELTASAVVKGDVAAPALHVVEGARLEGRVQMRTGQESGRTGA
jgi:cytoskeletal protein CcmA (bactofilin family)